MWLVLEKIRSYCQRRFGKHLLKYKIKFDLMGKNICHKFTCAHIFFSLNRLPFDWQTPIGYFAAMVLIFLLHMTALWWLLNIIFFLIGFVSFLALFAEQLEQELNLLNVNRKQSNGSQLNSKIFHIIELHWEAKQLSKIATISMRLYLKTIFFADLLLNFQISIDSLLLVTLFGA